MLHNYFKIAWRNLLKRRFLSLVSIVGLSVGMTFTFLIGSFVCGELQVNRTLKNADRQYLLQSKWKKEGMGIEIATLGPLAKTLKEEYPNLIANYYCYDGITVAVSHGDKHFREEVQAGDSTLLTMFGFPLLHGRSDDALKDRNSIVITAEKAMKYFGKTDVQGEVLSLDNFLGQKQSYIVTAVLKTLSDNSVNNLLKSQAGIFINMGTLEGRENAKNWNNPYMISFLELREGVKKEALAKPLSRLLSAHAAENIRNNLTVYATPLNELYLNQDNGLARKMIYVLSGVSLFILLMAIVNFINISIGNSASRIKEIGVRKVLGSLKSQLIKQFLAEYLILAGFSMTCSVVFYEVFRPYLAEILGKPIQSALSLFPYSLVAVVSFSIIIAFLAGIYPAFILSSLPAIESIKGKLKSVRENILFRRILIVSQFSIALFVFSAATLITKQIDYFFNKDLGYNKESVVYVPAPRDWTVAGVSKMESNRNELELLKEVSQVSLSYEIPNGNAGGSNGLYRLGQDSTEAVYTQVLSTDEKFAETFRLKLAAGHFFFAGQVSYKADEIVLNESAARALGFSDPEDAVGQQVRMHDSHEIFNIGGIIKDFHFASMHDHIKPLAFVHVRNGSIYRYLSFKMQPGNVGDKMAAIEKKWRQLMPDAPFEYVFMDDSLMRLYKTEIQLKKASGIATLLAIIIVLLGILGMVSLNVSRRTKEFGIRKVLGASGISIILLFLKEFAAVIGVSALIAFPLAYAGLTQWLESYAYRVTIGLENFTFVIITFCITVGITVTLMTFKAALMNPVNAIRTE